MRGDEKISLPLPGLTPSTKNDKPGNMTQKVKPGNKKPKKKAVALKYNPQNDSSPKIIGKGSGLIAEKIVQLAEEHGIPLHHDSDLVEILSCLKLYEEIPPETYVIVAEILAFIYRTNKSFTPPPPA